MESARITAELQVGDGPCEPLAGVRIVPPQPLRLRFHLAGGVDRNEARSLIREALGKAGYRLEEPTPDTIVAVIAEPTAPSSIAFKQLWRLRGPNGRVQGDPFTLYIGDPPTVVALDPITGTESETGNVPPDMWTGFLSPDGQWAMAVTVAADDCSQSRNWLLNLTTGEATETPLHYRFTWDAVGWHGGYLVTASGGSVAFYHLADGETEVRTVASRIWGESSPDGRYLTGYRTDYDRERPDQYAPVTVLLYDLATGQERTFADVAWIRVPHNDAGFSTRVFWSPDGKNILIADGRGLQPLSEGQTVVALDPVTGSASGSNTPADWPMWRPGPGGFSYRHIRQWGAVTVRSAAGEEHWYGDGFVLGWAPDGKLLLVRWAQDGLPHCEGI